MDLPQVDEAKTIAAVDKLLKKYHTFRRRAGQPIPQKLTSVISDEPRGTTSDHTIADTVLEKIDYQSTYDEINRALRLLDVHSRNILWGKYIASDRLTDYQRYSALCISHTTYYRWLDEARLEFSEAYNDGELIVHKK